jgi:hypothetical protein
MSRWFLSIAAIACFQATLACSEVQSETPEAPVVATRSALEGNANSPTQDAAPPASPPAQAPAQAAEPLANTGAPPGLRPNVNASATPTCPAATPAHASGCKVAEASAMACSYLQNAATTRCACVSRPDRPGAATTWNCERAANGEGPPDLGCPTSAPGSGSACTEANRRCNYAAVRCECQAGSLIWSCEPAARGGP